MPEVGERRATRHLRRRAEAESVKVGNVERSRAKAGAVATARGACFGNMAEGVGADVAERRGVFGAANADRIEDDDDGAGHGANLGAGRDVGKGSWALTLTGARLLEVNRRRKARHDAVPPVAFIRHRIELLKSCMRRSRPKPCDLLD